MNHKQILALFLFLVILASSRIVSKNTEIVKVKDVSSNVDKYHIENIKDEKDNNKINIFYPVTPYDNVNDEIMKNISYYRNEIYNSAYVSDGKKLDISFDEYDYKDYISFKFNVDSNVGVNHDFHEVFTIVYKNEKIININYLKEKKNDILDILYSECYDKLKENNNIKQYSNDKWLNTGLEKNEDNYRNFILTEDGLYVIFNEYTVAPHVAGNFEVLVQYDKLGEIL